MKGGLSSELARIDGMRDKTKLRSPATLLKFKVVRQNRRVIEIVNNQFMQHFNYHINRIMKQFQRDHRNLKFNNHFIMYMDNLNKIFLKPNFNKEANPLVCMNRIVVGENNSSIFL